MSKRKINFTDKDIRDIITKYEKHGFSCERIGKIYGVSKTPIKTILVRAKKLRRGRSDGKRINITSELINKIKDLYLIENKNSNEISKILGLTKSYIEKHLSQSNYRRSKSAAMSLFQTGKKRSKEVKRAMSMAQQRLVRDGKKKQTGGICKTFNVEGIICFGTYEKFFIEKLIRENTQTPTNTKPVNTPYGSYYPDFLYKESFIEIKSPYTYDVLVGKQPNPWSGKVDTNQLDKIRWVNDNILPVVIVVVDKRNDKLISIKVE